MSSTPRRLTTTARGAFLPITPTVFCSIRRFHSNASLRGSPGPDVPSAICHYPFAPADYVQTNPTASSSGEYVLVVGNELDHKDVRQTVGLLSTAFPFQGLVVLGVRLEPSDILRSYSAGSLSEAEIQRLYSGARCIVFPSFYEGFGFPIVTALAYGKTLIARRSDLLQRSPRIAARAPDCVRARRSSSASSAVCCAGNRSRPSRSGLLRARRDGGLTLRRMSYRSWTPGCGSFPESAGASATTRSTSCSPSARDGAYHILSMKIVSVASLPLSDVKVIRFARFTDDRGYFTEPFRRSDFDTHPEMEFLRGQSFVQSNESFPLERGAALSVEPVYMGKLHARSTGTWSTSFSTSERVHLAWPGRA